jgi:hypothetical protein
MNRRLSPLFWTFGADRCNHDHGGHGRDDESHDADPSGLRSLGPARELVSDILGANDGQLYTTPRSVGGPTFCKLDKVVEKPLPDTTMRDHRPLVPAAVAQSSGLVRKRCDGSYRFQVA